MPSESKKVFLWFGLGAVALLFLNRKAVAAIGEDVQIKPGVNLEGIQPQLVMAAQVADEVYTSNGFALTITSANDSQHMEGSLHYQGRALDLRTRDLPEGMAATLAGEIRSRLGNQFDVILEADHIHIEYDPKTT